MPPRGLFEALDPRPPLSGGLLGQLAAHDARPGSPAPSDNGLLATLYRQLWRKDNRPQRLSFLDAARHVAGQTIGDAASAGQFLVQNVLPGSSDARSAIDAWNYSGAGLNNLRRGDWLSAGGDFSNMALAEFGVLPFIPNLAGMTRAVRELPGIGSVGKSTFRSLKVPSDISGETMVFRNPTEEQMRSMAQRAKHTTLRWMRAPDGNVYVWPAWDVTHYEMNRHLGNEGDPTNAGQLIFDNGQWFKF